MAVSGPKNTRQRLGFLFSLPLVFCLVFFLMELAGEKTDIHLLQIQNLQTSVAVLESLAKDAESSERGFLLTGEESARVAFQQVKEALPKQMAFTRSSAKDHPELTAQLDNLIALVEKRINQESAVLAIQQKDGFAAAIEQTKSGKSASTMSELRKSSIDLLKRLNEEEDGYLRSQRTLNYWAFIFFGVGTAVMIGVLYWLYNEVLSYLYARDLAQQQLERFNTDLQAMVDERTKELVEANQELQQFAYVASHDLQEPLRTITSFSQLMAARYKGRLEEDADEFIGYIVTASKRMTDLINGLLQIVRLRKAGQPTTRVPLERLVDDAEANLQALIRENGVTIEKGSLPELLVDRVQMSQVFQNLISNAIKYRSEKPPVIQVDAKRQDSEWIISVKDNGRGFDQEFSERIFGLFQRLHGRDVEGTGMGLSISRRIVERHGGRIWAKSEEGKGATFFFSLPASLEVMRQALANSETAKTAMR
jgi:signal transduction histidine kinase